MIIEALWMKIQIFFHTISRMWIGMNETRIEDLFGKNAKQFAINVGYIKLILFNSINITNFIAIDPFGR